MNKKKIHLYAALLGAAALVLTGCAGGGNSATDSGGGSSSNGSNDSSAETLIPVTVAVAPDFMFTEYYVAKEIDAYKEAGLDATLVEYPSAYEALDAVVAGQADVTTASATLLTSLAGKGTSVIGVANNLFLEDWVTLVARDGIVVNQASDMVGLKVGSTWNGIMDYSARKFLTANDVSVDQLNYEDVKYAQLLPALQSGSVDVVTLAEPNTSKALEAISGSSVVMNSSEYGEMYGFMVMTKDANSNSELKNRMFDAMVITHKAIANDISLAVKVAMDNSGLEDEAQATEIQTKVKYSLNFDSKPLDWAQGVADYYREMGLTDATDEEIWEMYDIDGFDR